MPHTLLYGGTFDPIHHGHLITCQRARELLNADRVLFIPAQISPHKLHQQTAPPDHRLAMLHRAIADNPHFLADGRELDRQGPSYTFDTLASLRTEFPGDTFTLLIGADQVAKFHTWHRARDLVVGIGHGQHQKGGVAIMARRGWDMDGAWTVVQQHLGPAIAEQFRASILETPLIDISATDIRRRVSIDLPIDYLVPTPVADYIREHGLYKLPTTTPVSPVP